jgi:hypothetical protein
VFRILTRTNPWRSPAGQQSNFFENVQTKLIIRKHNPGIETTLCSVKGCDAKQILRRIADDAAAGAAQRVGAT